MNNEPATPVPMTSEPSNGSPAVVAATVMASAVDRNHLAGPTATNRQQPLASVIELTPLAFSSDTCPQCSSVAAKTSFMTFDELADVTGLTSTTMA